MRWDSSSGSGTSQTSENPCDRRPAAELNRARSFSIAIIIVSSTIAASPRCASRDATISSVTVSGVVDIASAYPSTSRSTGENTSEARHRITSRIFSRSMPSLCAR